MGYVLNTSRMRVVELNDKGRAKKRRTFRKGDEVTEADFAHDEGRFEALVASGALVDEDSLGDDEDTLVDPSRAAHGTGATQVDEGSPDVAYEDWDYDVLKAALSERNADRDDDDQIEPESMSKANIAAALRADDEAKSDE